MVDRIDGVLASLPTSEIPNWAQAPLGEGLRRLRLVMEYLEFFGTEVAIDELLDLYHEAKAVEVCVERDSRKGGSFDRLKTLLAILGVIQLAGDLFALPAQTYSAMQTYRGWHLSEVTTDPKLPNPSRKFLPAPEAIVPEEVKETETPPPADE